MFYKHYKIFNLYPLALYIFTLLFIGNLKWRKEFGNAPPYYKRQVSTKKERKPITLHHVRESHVVEIDNITRARVTPLSYGQQGIKLALTHRMMDDMDLSLAAKRTKKKFIG